jgi:hypothetical protein
MLGLQSCTDGREATPSIEPPSPAPSPSTEEPTEPTLESSQEVPEDFKEYQEPAVGVSIFLPDTWVEIKSDPGRLIILQSYSSDKYIGEEAFEPVDTKCDLSIRPPDVDMVDQNEAIRTSSNSTIVSEDEVALQSGEKGVRLGVEGLGRFLSMVTEINERSVVLNCFGELEPLDEIASSLHGCR